ncbi:hypothetical protein Rain11_0880 [Raineya orbicola]|uniref:Uncharacterized protein n=2 Tax=Raineya orbicola TaxID=2016530 RepID=A0A2N3IIF7_9BACT|nr:hypothetical protein Rain11_0880 [Raineya orbicola]
MKDTKFYEMDFIEAYVKGKVSEAENQIMQKLISQDAQLASEVELQKDLQEALARTRRAELKQLLQNTPVPTSTFAPTISQWIAASFGIVGLVAMIWFFVKYWGSEKTNQKQAVVLKTQNETLKKDESKQVVENTTTTTENFASQNTQKLTIENNQKLNESKKAEKNKDFTKEIFYQYDGKNVLQIFGDFSYEILENIPTKDGEKNFIFVQNKFYELVPTPEDEVRNLKENEVKNPDLIRLLSERLKNK